MCLKIRLIHSSKKRKNKSLKSRLKKVRNKMKIFSPKGMLILILVVIQASQVKTLINWGITWNIWMDKLMKRKVLPKKKKKIATRNSDKANDKVEDSYDKAEQKANNKKTPF